MHADGLRKKNHFAGEHAAALTVGCRVADPVAHSGPPGPKACTQTEEKAKAQADAEHAHSRPRAALTIPREKPRLMRRRGTRGRTATRLPIADQKNEVHH
jgi:hypothetical protein